MSIKLLDLHTDLLRNVLAHADPGTLLNFGRTCQQARAIVDEEATWKGAAERTLRPSSSNAAMLAHGDYRAAVLMELALATRDHQRMGASLRRLRQTIDAHRVGAAIPRSAAINPPAREHVRKTWAKQADALARERTALGNSLQAIDMGRSCKR